MNIKTGNENGAVIIIVLVVLLLISIMASTMMNRALFEMQRAKNLFLYKRSELTAYSAIEEAKADIPVRLTGNSYNNFTFLLDGSQSDLVAATAANNSISYKEGELNDLQYKLVIENNRSEILRGMVSEDKDKIVLIKAQVEFKNKVLYTLHSHFLLDDDKNTVKIISNHRSLE